MGLYDIWRPGEILLLDGGMGTMLQDRGLPAGRMPELLNLEQPDLIASVHREYAAAGSRIVYANTFGANALKLRNTGHTVREIVSAAVSLARKAVGDSAAVALDMGPLGVLLEPMGTLPFEDAVGLFRELAKAGEAAGADLAVIETMTDLMEARAALLAVKENTRLPVFVTMSFEERGRTFTGCTIPSMARTLEGLGADAVGLNCSIGPDRLAPLLRDLAENTRLPVIAKPNAGLPDPIDGHYDMGPEDFAASLSPCLDVGVTLFGGCCGTTPAYIRRLNTALRERLGSMSPDEEGQASLTEKNAPSDGHPVHRLELSPPDGQPPRRLDPPFPAPPPRHNPGGSFVCTAVTPCPIQGVRVIGERVNPTGKKRFQQALIEEDLDYILEVAVQEEDAGADILDVNVGFPGVDEVSMLPRVVRKIQSAVSIPLQLDSSNPAALEAGLRVYNGKAAVNSVNGDRDVLDRILPVVKKYGAAVVGLTLDRDGIPPTAEGRVAIAKRILDAALSYGIPRADVWMDCLTLTVSAQQEQAGETLKAVRYVREIMGLQTVLGVSNISFGLPNRILITRTFLAQALEAGLSLPIVNPNQREIMDTVSAFRVLSGADPQCRDYLARFAGTDSPAVSNTGGASGMGGVSVPSASSPQSASFGSSHEPEDTAALKDAVIRGLKGDAGLLARRVLIHTDGLSLVERVLIPALDTVGDGYEKGTLFLPQLLSAAQAAQAVFEAVRSDAAERGGAPVKKGRLIVATVRGDIHDIGKNIVKTVLENYGYEVLDLGRDVPPETIAQAVTEKAVGLVGLSALMTTTLPAMEETIHLLHTLPRPPVIFVGGAVVTPEYAKRMGADYYAKDARASVEIARKVLG